MNFWRSFGRSLAAAAVPLILAGCSGAVDLQAELAAAESAAAAGDWARVRDHAAAALSAASGNVDACLYAFRAAMALGDVEAAQAHAAAAAKSRPGDADVMQAQAQAAFAAGDLNGAYRHYVRIAGDRELPAEVRSLGWAGMGAVDLRWMDRLTETNDLADRARTELLRALNLDRRNAPAYYHLALLYRGASFGFSEAALEQFRFYVKLMGPVADERVRRVQREVIPALEQEIREKASARYGAARRDAAACAKALEQADAAAKKRRYSEARKHYAEALKRDPLCREAALGQARCCERTDKTANGKLEAYRAYRTACELDRNDVPTMLHTAELALKLNNPVSAVSLYSRALAAERRSIEAVKGLIKALEQAGGNSNRMLARVYGEYLKSLTAAARR